MPSTVFGLAQVQVIRTLDWLVDAPVPGPGRHFFEHSADAAQRSYYRLPRWWLIRRTGELMAALQLRELTWGDASAAFSAITDASAGPGSGTVVRVNNLIDWTQRVVGDGNRLLGAPAHRSRGLVNWRLPIRAVDGLQWGLLKTFNQVSVIVARTLDETLTGLERAGELAWNAGWSRPHRETAVFVRLPMRAYRAHEVWILEHRRRLTIGTAAQFAATTHAALQHQRKHPVLMDWADLEGAYAQLTEVVLLAPPALMARAPATLQAYVVPAAWVLDPPPASVH